MKPPHVILALLVAAFALGDTASLAYVRATHQGWPDLPGVILLSLVFGQQTLAAAWFTFARGNIAVRLLIALGGEFGLAMVAAGAAGVAQKFAPWFAIQLFTIGLFVVPLWAVKHLRWQISLAGPMHAAVGAPSWQFSIWSLLSGTTAAAIALAAARQVDMRMLPVRGEAIAFFACIVANGLLVFTVSMAIRIPAVAATATLAVVVLACPLAGMLIGRTGFPPETHAGLWAIFGFCQGATISIAVLVLRVAGYRLARSPLATPAREVAE